MTEHSHPTGEFPMPGHPGVPEGLRAYAQPTHADGTFDHDRAGRPKVRRVHLRAHPPTPPERPDGLVNNADWNWATSAPRRWNTITTRLDDRADDVALALARAGCVGLEHDYRSGTICHPPRGWAPNPDLRAARQEQDSQRAARRATQDDEACRLAAELTHYSAAAPLVAILRAQRDGPYRDHVIEAARAFPTDDTTTDTGGAAPWAAVHWLKRGTKADYNRDHEPLAEGGQGAVYSGMHKHTRIPIALKQLRYSDEDALHRMRREISIGHLYGEHPNVMPVLDSDPDGRWFVMPLANGSAASHAERLQRETGALRELVIAVCKGLRRPHTDGRIHRDIKPANVLLLNGKWVVADWGLGRQPRGETSIPHRTRTGTGFGSEGFAAPELSSGNPHNVTAAADIYSIGRLIAAILTGERPEQNLPLLPVRGPWVAAVTEATHHRPTDRPQDVDEFLRLLKDIP